MEYRQANMSSPPVTKIEIALINADLNSTILYVLLMGMYTMVFIWSLHIYYSRKENRNDLITATLVALYITNVVDLGIQWQFIKSAFVDNGETRISILSALSGSTVSEAAIIQVGSVLQYVGYLLANGLLVWRCFQITNRSFLAIFVPLFLYFCVFAISIVSLTFSGLLSFNPGRLPAISEKSSVIIASGSIVYVLDAATSLSASFIIFYRISKSLDTHISGQTRYKRIIRMVIETAVLYSSTSIVVAVLALVNLFSSLEVSLNTSIAINYLLVVNAIATGLAPTIMVVQISLASSQVSTETDSSASAYQISALEFHHPQTVNTTHLKNDTQCHVSSSKELHGIQDSRKQSR